MHASVDSGFLLFLNINQKYLPLCDVECEFVAAFLSRNTLQTVCLICLYFQKNALLLLFYHSPPPYLAVKNWFAPSYF